MIVAATYENGEIFGHFGRTETFKLYEVEDGAVKSAKVIGVNGAGHGALAGVLKENGVQVLICGGIGGGARDALAQLGIQFVSGASGSADEAVAAWLGGTLVTSGVTCGHHHHGEGHSCGEHGCHHHGE